jgi:putative transposase
MTEIRKTKHAAYDLKYHFVWTPKYRKKMLKGKVAKYVGKTFQKIAEEYGWEIEGMSIREDHVHLFSKYPRSMH